MERKGKREEHGREGLWSHNRYVIQQGSGEQREWVVKADTEVH